MNSVIDVVVLFALISALGLALWWLERRHDRQFEAESASRRAVLEAVATHREVKPAPLRVRYLDGKGRVLAEEWVDPRHRRATRTYEGRAYVATRQTEGVWEYRPA